MTTYDIIKLMDYKKFSYLRNRTIPDFTVEEPEDPYAMVFLIEDNKEKTHTDKNIYKTVVDAMLMILSEPEAQERNLAWLNGRIRKIIKRGRNTPYETAVTSFPGAIEENNSERVTVFPPFKKSETPEAIRKLQVTGLKAQIVDNPDGLTENQQKYFDTLREINADPKMEKTIIKTIDDIIYNNHHNLLHINVNKDLNMSVSKTAVQVAHAVQLFIMKGEEKKVKQFFNTGANIKVEYTSNMNDIEYDIVVHDAGFTEIPAGSLTCTATWVN